MKTKSKKTGKSNVKLPDDWKKPISRSQPDSSAPEFTAELLEPKNVKEKISIWIDQDVLDKVREAAHKNGEKYQPLINRILRQVFSPDDSLSPKTIEDVMAQLHALWNEIGALKRKTGP